MASVKFYTTNLVGSFSQLSTGAKNSATGIFALKALVSSPALVLNLRRSTDNATADFYADIPGNLTTSSGQTFASWIGAATAYVTKWYDQSSGARHATQVTTGNQPTFDGTTINFTSASNQYLDTPASCFTDLSSFTVTCRHTTAGNSGDQGIWGIGNSFSFGSNNLIRPGGGAGYRNYFLGLDFNVGTYAVGNIVTLKYAQSTGTGVSPSNGTRTLYINQTSAGTNATTGWTGNGPGGGFLGHGSFAGAMDGGLYYIFMFNTALSDADRSIVENQPVAPPAPSIPMSMTIGPGPSPNPIGIFGLPPLYPFTTFTFTPMTATGASGPGAITYGASTPGYGTTSVMTLSGGIQYWKVPYSGNYTFTIAGACGGAGGPATRGLGAVITVTLPLTQGDVLQLLVGQMGTSAVSGCPVTKGGGGGGSFVYNNTTSTILLVAGGGAGCAGGPIVTAGQANASLTPAGNAGDGTNGGAGGTTGGGGTGGVSACGNTAGGNGGGGGGGYSGNGTNGSFAASNLGQSFLNGGVGGSNTSEGTTYGGFGGGGAAGHHAGGGGGGYSGGGGGGLQTCSCADTQTGGGGGSYATVSFTSSAVTNAGDGYITITKV